MFFKSTEKYKKEIAISLEKIMKILTGFYHCHSNHKLATSMFNQSLLVVNSDSVAGD